MVANYLNKIPVICKYSQWFVEDVLKFFSAWLGCVTIKIILCAHMICWFSCRDGHNNNSIISVAQVLLYSYTIIHQELSVLCEIMIFITFFT